MFKIPEFLDVWKINETISGVVIKIENDEIELICRDKITGKVFYKNELLLDSDDDNIKFKLFNENYKFIGKSELIDIVFNVK